MTIRELHDDILAKKLGHVYVFYGEESAVIDLYIEAMCKSLNLTRVYADTITDAVSLSSSTLDNNLVIVNSPKVIDDDLHTLRAHAGNPIVLVYDAIDKRSKAWKALGKDAVEFAPLPFAIVRKHLPIDLSFNHALALWKRCGGKYTTTLKESALLGMYARSRGISADDAYIVLDKYLPNDDTYGIFDAFDTFIESGRIDGILAGMDSMGFLMLSISLLAGDKRSLMTNDSRAGYIRNKGLRLGVISRLLKVALDEWRDVTLGGEDSSVAGTILLASRLLTSSNNLVDN